ncbi:hypothetical protein [Aureibacillus halotolerans]|uniref:hypothetical protein n=1 Tax=Aureibacillus halotolerans TaxID=1508390 RepID=UPI00105BB9AD|nr:hypothetical protein [Aureibacillus halotolerans]
MNIYRIDRFIGWSDGLMTSLGIVYFVALTVILFYVTRRLPSVLSRVATFFLHGIYAFGLLRFAFWLYPITYKGDEMSAGGGFAFLFLCLLYFFYVFVMLCISLPKWPTAIPHPFKSMPDQ